MFIVLELIMLIVVDLDIRLRGKVIYMIFDIVGVSVLNDEEVFYCINELYGIFRINLYMGILRVVRKLVVWCVYNVIVCVMDYGSLLLFSIILLFIEIGNGNVIVLGILIIIVIVL